MDGTAVSCPFNSSKVACVIEEREQEGTITPVSNLQRSCVSNNMLQETCCSGDGMDEA